MTSPVWDFLLIFFISFFILVIIIVALVFRAKPKIDQREVKEKQDVSQEKVIIKEIIKIRCRYCGFTYDQGLNSCPNCGAGT
jgi:hypothetical protein